MSAFFDRFSSLCQEKGETPNSVGKKLGIPSGSITAWRNGTIPRVATLDKISNFFGVSTDFLRGVEHQSPIVQCKDCGLTYNSSVPDDIRQHEKRHKAWEKAVQKFGFCWSYMFREKEKAEARHKISSGNLSDEEYIEAQITVFKALFSRSLEGSDYNLKHVNFKNYVAMMLNQEQWKKSIPPKIYMKMSAKYGVKSGISNGTYYEIPSYIGDQSISFDDFTYAMQNESKDLTEADKQILLSMAKQLNDARKKKNGESD